MNDHYPGYTLSRFDGKCPCGTLTDETLGYSEYYDTFFCTVCRTWMSPPCGDPRCEDCKNRPEKAIFPTPSPNALIELGWQTALQPKDNGVQSWHETLRFPFPALEGDTD